MTFLYPLFFWLIIPLGLLWWQRPKKIVTIVHLWILLLLLLSLARPVIEEALEKTDIEGKELIIALDVSYSMQATDIAPTRYDFAKQTITTLLNENPGDNIMLVAFTTNPLLLSPPTTDHALIKIALESLNPNYILTKGTSLQHLFQKLSLISKGDKNLLLITDGGEESDLAGLTQLAQKSQIKLTILGLGTQKGTTIKNKEGTLLRDEENNLVISRLNPLLHSLADSVSGDYFTPSFDPDETARKINDTLKQKTQTSINAHKLQHHYLELYPFVLGVALLLFFLVHTSGIRYIIILFSLLGIDAQASMVDDYHLSCAYKSYKRTDFHATQEEIKQIKTPSLQSQMLLANTYYKQGLFHQAIATYKSIRSTSPAVKQHLYYNIANTYAMLASYDKAKIYYTKALQLGKDIEAEENLHLILFLTSKQQSDLGMAHPKSQDSASSKSESTDDTKEKKSEDEPSSGSGGGGESQTQQTQQQHKLLDNGKQEKLPLGSKVYELINEGYIREKQPW
ncbi:MAG: hypothetical protein RLZZ428_575 [Pseudomonadota bacterium]|jgi:Ca-activated chloride channel family protein